MESTLLTLFVNALNRFKELESVKEYLNKKSSKRSQRFQLHEILLLVKKEQSKEFVLWCYYRKTFMV